jgi:hypothetical protein
MLNLIASAIKAKAPIVAIPVEGHAPIYVYRKRLAAWSKGVTVITAHVQGRFLLIEGRAGNVKTRASFNSIGRRKAIKELSVWSERNRLRLQKKILLGALSPDQKKALKRLKHEDAGEDMIPVMVAGLKDSEPKREMLGFPVAIPELPLLSFAVVRFGTDEACNISFSVTELISGKCAGSGPTAEAAILEVRQRVGELSPEQIAKLQETAA